MALFILLFVRYERVWKHISFADDKTSVRTYELL